MVFMKKIKSFISAILFLLLLLSPAVLPGKDDLKFSKSIRKEASRWGFKIEFTTALPNNGLAGKVQTPEQAEGELLRFFAALDVLGKKFVKQSGLKNVLIVKDLSRHGKNLTGHVSNDTIYLKYGFSKKTVYHEMFHVFDDKHDDKNWRNLNHKDFRYLGISYPNRPLDGKKQKDIDKHYRKVKRNFDADFVSKYAQSNEREDRAETFAAMIEQGPRFAAKAAKSPVLHAKMMYMVKLTGKRSLITEAAWRKKLGDKVFSSGKK